MSFDVEDLTEIGRVDPPRKDGRQWVHRVVPIAFLAVVGCLLTVGLVVGIRALPSPAPYQPEPQPSLDGFYDPPLVAVDEPASEEPVGYQNPFGHPQDEDELSEDMTRRYILGMAKQKVIATYNRTIYEMTPERLEWLSSAVEKRTDFADRGVYLDILTRWRSGDFSGAVEDHNAVWTLLDGEIGEAHGLANAREEARFILEYYRDGADESVL